MLAVRAARNRRLYYLPKRRPFPRVGGRVPNVGLSIPSGDNIVLPFGVPLHFRHCGHGPRTTGSKKNPSSSVCPMPSPVLPAFNPNRALPYPVCVCLLFPTLLKQPKSRLLILIQINLLLLPLTSTFRSRNSFHCH